MCSFPTQAGHQCSVLPFLQEYPENKHVVMTDGQVPMLKTAIEMGFHILLVLKYTKV